jgi:hypothetical protein
MDIYLAVYRSYLLLLLHMILFEPKEHKYTHAESGLEYISVTTLVDKYKKPYDSKYWSLYKAAKDVLSAVNKWHFYKKQAGGWMKVVKHFNAHGASIYTDKIKRRQKWYLDKWRKEKELACALGTEFHDDMESLTNSIRTVTDDTQTFEVFPGQVLLQQGFSTDGMFTEILLFNTKYRIAGKADRVLRTGNKVVVKDYKTCKTISNDPFMEQRMLAPLDELYDTKFNHIMMQLSTYGWMLEQYGYEVDGLEINHANRETGLPIADIPVPYRPDLVKAMVEHLREDEF